MDALIKLLREDYQFLYETDEDIQKIAIDIRDNATSFTISAVSVPNHYDGGWVELTRPDATSRWTGKVFAQIVDCINDGQGPYGSIDEHEVDPSELSPEDRAELQHIIDVFNAI
jgi:hypothetical protein